MTNKLNILHLIGSVSIGGAQHLVLDLAGKTNPKDFNVHLCTFGPVKEKSFLSDFFSLGLPFLQIKSKHFYDPRVLWMIIKFIRQNKIDIIHTHLTDADIVGRFAGLITRIPVITTIHNEPKRFISLRIDRRVLNYLTALYLTTHLVAVSEFLRQKFIEEWKIPAAKISTVYNAIDVSMFLEIPVVRKRKLGAQNFTITNVGSLSKQKAQHILLHAAKKVLAEFPEAKILIVGQGKMEDELKQLAGQLELTKQVVFTGMRRDIKDILASSDVFVMSSLWEGLPLSAIEAMASACATILTDVGGNRELIEHEKSGLLVPPGDSNALADAILSVLWDEGRRLSFARQARAAVVEKFDINSLVREYEKLYQRVLTHVRVTEAG